MRIVFYLSVMVCALKTSAQFALSYYPFQSLLSVSTNPERLVWADYRVETNTFMTNLNMELSPMVNLKRTEVVNYYCGAGVSFNPVYAIADYSPLNGYFIDVGARMKPFSKNRNVQILFEISPYVNRSIASGNFRTRLGLAYRFHKKENTEKQK